MEPARRYGFAMNKPNFDRVFAVSELPSKVHIAMTSIHPFIHPYENVVVFPMASLYARIKAMKLGNTEGQINITIGCGEVIALALPDSMVAEQQEARAYLVQVMSYALNNLPKFRDLKLSTEMYLKVFGTADRPVNVKRALFVGAEFFEVWPSTAAQIATLTPITARSVLYYFSMASTKDDIAIAVTMISTVYLAWAKRGNITGKCIEKVTDGIRDEIGLIIDLDPVSIQQVYSSYCTGVDENSASATLTFWLGLLPPRALRLKLVLDQASGSGLTVYQIMGRALLKYPDFSWSIVNSITGGEVTNFKLAHGAIGNNMFYGFAKDLGAARSTLYKSAAYPAFELLIKLNGEGTLKSYKGRGKNIKSKAIMDKMIAEYVETKSSEGYVATEDELKEISEMTEEISASAGNFQ